MTESLRYDAEEAKRLHAEMLANWASVGYVAKTPYRSGHSFSTWVEKFRETHRDYFGELPNGERILSYPGLPNWIFRMSKMCVSNEAVVDEKIAEWEVAQCLSPFMMEDLES